MLLLYVLQTRTAFRRYWAPTPLILFPRIFCFQKRVSSCEGVKELRLSTRATKEVHTTFFLNSTPHFRRLRYALVNPETDLEKNKTALIPDE